jgi:ketosteroid isomerase-like protein
MSSEENLTIARTALEAFQRGDIETLVSFMDPEMETFSSPELANPVDVVGRDEWLAWMGRWLEVWDDYEIEALSIDAVGDHHVIVDMLQTAKGKGSGVDVELRVYTVFEIRDGLAKRYHLYPTREEAVAFAERGESDAG